MGRRQKLAIVRRLEGNPGKRPIEDHGIVVDGTPFVPEHLSDEAQACVELVRESMPPGVLGTVDTFVLSAFAVAWSLHKRAVLETGAPGFQHMSGGRINPWVRILNQQARIMAMLGSRMGLDPHARAALKLPEPGQRRSKFDGLIGLEAAVQ